MYWISMHLLELVIQMLVCTWDTAALWPQGIAVESMAIPVCPDAGRSFVSRPCGTPA